MRRAQEISQNLLHPSLPWDESKTKINEQKIDLTRGATEVARFGPNYATIEVHRFFFSQHYPSIWELKKTSLPEPILEEDKTC